MTEKEEDIQTQHEWRNQLVDAWHSGMSYATYPFPPGLGQPMSKRGRVRQKEADEVFKEFREWYDDWFRVRKVQYNRVSSSEC